MVFDKIKKVLSGAGSDGNDNEYLEIDLGQEKKENKVIVKLFVLKNYDDVNGILNALREGYTIAVIDIKILRQKDPIELKRAVSKIKKTTDALEGSIAGFGENTVIVTPSFAKIQKEEEAPKEEKKEQVGLILKMTGEIYPGLYEAVLINRTKQEMLDFSLKSGIKIPEEEKSDFLDCLIAGHLEYYILNEDLK